MLPTSGLLAAKSSAPIRSVSILFALPSTLFWALTLWHTSWCARQGACPRAGSALHAGQGQRRGRSSLSSAFTTLTARRLRLSGASVEELQELFRATGWPAGAMSRAPPSSGWCSTLSRHRLAHSRQTASTVWRGARRRSANQAAAAVRLVTCVYTAWGIAVALIPGNEHCYFRAALCSMNRVPTRPAVMFYRSVLHKNKLRKATVLSRLFRKRYQLFTATRQQNSAPRLIV